MFIGVGSCGVQEANNVVSGIEFEQVTEFHHGTRVVDICWSLLTDLHSVPRHVAYVLPP